MEPLPLGDPTASQTMTYPRSLLNFLCKAQALIHGRDPRFAAQFIADSSLHATMKVAGNKKGALGMSGTPLLIAAVVTRLGGAAGGLSQRPRNQRSHDFSKRRLM